MLYALDGTAPRLPDGFCFIAETASVIGDVVLEDEASVWFGAVIRGDTERISIGARSNVQDNCTLHTDRGLTLTIGAQCTVGHGAILHGCAIGEGSLIGMGACVLNRAVIGKSCLIGAGTLIPEGTVVPDGSLVVGRPGRVVRMLDDEGRARLLASAEHYVANARRFAAGLVPLRLDP